MSTSSNPFQANVTEAEQQTEIAILKQRIEELDRMLEIFSVRQDADPPQCRVSTKR
jgi:hypothetical protein